MGGSSTGSSETDTPKSGENEDASQKAYINGAAYLLEDIEDSYKKGSFTLESNPVKRSNGVYAPSTFVIPVSILTNAENATKSAEEAFKFIFETPIGSYVLPANLTNLIPDYAKLIAGSPSNISIKVTITDNSLVSPVSNKISPIVDIKLELIDGKGKVITAIENFTDYVERIIPVSAKEKPKYWRAQTRKNNNSEWVFVPAKWDADGVHILNKSNNLYVVVEYTPKFTDVAEDAWYYDNVVTAASKKLVRGINTAETIYNPEAMVTRAEFAAMIAKALMLPAANEGIESYTDVKESDWFIKDGTLISAKSAGLLDLLETNGKFNPNQKLTREEMAYMLAKAAEYCETKLAKPVDLKTKFTDSTTIESKYTKYVETVISLKLMKGMTETTFGGNGMATRAQAATVLINMCKTFGWID